MILRRKRGRISGLWRRHRRAPSQCGYFARIFGLKNAEIIFLLAANIMESIGWRESEAVSLVASPIETGLCHGLVLEAVCGPLLERVVFHATRLLSVGAHGNGGMLLRGGR
jgi:hypothetical protein